MVTLINSQAQQQMQLNNSIQTLLKNAQTQLLTSDQLSLISQTQILVSNATFLILQAQTQTQTVQSIAGMYVPQQQALYNDMIVLVNNLNNLLPVAQSQLARTFLNRTLMAIKTAQNLELTEAVIIATESSALIASLQIQSKILEFQYVLDQKSYQDLMNQTNKMILMIVNTSNYLYSSIAQANSVQQAAIQSNFAQYLALQASIKAARLALCYPSPCMNGGMCTVNSDNASFTCFCSSNFKGKVNLLINLK